MFPALNITGVARVELSARMPSAMEAEAIAIFNAIRYARREADEKAAEIREAKVCDMHKTLFYLIISPQGHVLAIWKNRLEEMDGAQ